MERVSLHGAGVRLATYQEVGQAHNTAFLNEYAIDELIEALRRVKRQLKKPVKGNDIPF